MRTKFTICLIFITIFCFAQNRAIIVDSIMKAAINKLTQDELNKCKKSNSELIDKVDSLEKENTKLRKEKNALENMFESYSVKKTIFFIEKYLITVKIDEAPLSDKDDIKISHNDHSGNNLPFYISKIKKIDHIKFGTLNTPNDCIEFLAADETYRIFFYELNENNEKKWLIEENDNVMKTRILNAFIHLYKLEKSSEKTEIEMFKP